MGLGVSHAALAEQFAGFAGARVHLEGMGQKTGGEPAAGLDFAAPANVVYNLATGLLAVL